MDEQATPRRILVADPVAKEGIERLKQAGEVDVITGQTQDQLVACIGDYDAMVVRSETKVTEPIFAAAKRLKVVARAGVGVDNIDVTAATRYGVVVVNSPEGNTIAAAEHSIAMLLAMSRKIPAAAASLGRGEWKRSQFVGVEVYNKALGVVGLGKIGREVARRARGLGMRVLAHDAFVSPEVARREGVELVELKQLFQESDYITVHTPLTRDTRGLVNDEAFALMKDGVRLINCARGGIIDESALLRALDSGKVAAAAVDVFEQEPPVKDSPAQALTLHPKVLATPHLGASTEEAQVNVAVDVADQIVGILAGKPPRSAVNMPAIAADVFARIEPALELGVRIGKLHAQLADSPITAVSVTYSGELLNEQVQPVTRGVLMGLLQPVLAQSVNFVNAPYIAEQRGIRVTESKTAGQEEYSNYICVEVEEQNGRRRIGGTVLGRRDYRIREIDQFRIDLRPEGYLLFARHTDRPGIIGAVGTMLGEAGVNIGGMYVGREERGKRAVMVLTVDETVPEDLLQRIEDVIQADLVRFVEL
ncbi:MAG: D-3-phosphoglycerate dehydrogenase [Armatimonadetes bacterium]|nr:D-3-phosphoglycerate dehydrogenase [Armatimonadota bacterium]